MLAARRQDYTDLPLLVLLSSLGVFFALSVPYLYLKASANLAMSMQVPSRCAVFCYPPVYRKFSCPEGLLCDQ